MLSFEDFDIKVFGQNPSELTLCCIATHYEGEPCDNTALFFKWCQGLKKEKEKLFTELNFAIFGLGESNYEKFNEMGKYFDDLFVSLGGKRVFTLGVGDSKDNTTEDSFDQWRTMLWPAI